MPITRYEDNPRCEAEIGHARTGQWHACGKPAKVFVDRQMASGSVFTLTYCAKHAKNSKNTAAVRTIATGMVVDSRKRG